MDVVGIFGQASSLVYFVYLVVLIAATGGTWMQVVLVFVFLGASLGIGFARKAHVSGLRLLSLRPLRQLLTLR
jgi:general stress protein CsbA